MSTLAAAPEAREPTCECGHDHQRGGTTACFADGCRCLDFRAPARPAPQGAPGFDMDRVMNEFVNAIHDGDDDRAQRAQNTLYDQFATLRDTNAMQQGQLDYSRTLVDTLRAQAVAGAEDTARLVKADEAYRTMSENGLRVDPAEDSCTVRADDMARLARAVLLRGTATGDSDGCICGSTDDHHTITCYTGQDGWAEVERLRAVLLNMDGMAITHDLAGVRGEWDYIVNLDTKKRINFTIVDARKWVERAP